jgi:protein-L-isoaspartate(D-aspartate) O-methyltransferase
MLDRLFTSDQAVTAEQERRRMIDEQLRARGIRDGRVLAAMAKAPREAFAQVESPQQAYGDFPLPIAAGQTVSQPYMVASMVEALQVRPSDKVLEVGSGTGYQAAVLAELAREVWTIERIPELGRQAQENLARLGYGNVRVVVGDGSRGLPDEAPFDKVIVAAAAPNIPPALLGQLADGGTLVLPIGSRTEQQIQVLRKIGSEVVTTQRELCRFVPLVGKAGWQE